VSALESCLKTKYKEIETKQFQGRLIDLIGWVENRLKLQGSNVAQALRMLRNEIIHEDKIIDDPRLYWPSDRSPAFSSRCATRYDV
jgi:hypothetical protein